MTFKSGRKCENRLGPGKNILFYLKDIKMVAQTNGFRVSISKVRPESQLSHWHGFVVKSRTVAAVALRGLKMTQGKICSGDTWTPREETVEYPAKENVCFSLNMDRFGCKLFPCDLNH